MGVIGMHITSTPLDRVGLLAFEQQQVTTLFGVDSHEDCDSGIPGVTMSKPVSRSPLPAGCHSVGTVTVQVPAVTLCLQPCVRVRW